ncbi:polynucleotide 5'-hydroxyl-kinase NOL9-like [Salvia splendens]|uniref:polynucleotide 5'-hydroxyl-kinase NOL9-like n=1 Tax=Salvia splendens TaxID=180675 RepID=UPI001C269ECD|nr:polynucleotide 5'-hydroxyl-kinase NOL9-like [Salvia splendens]
MAADSETESPSPQIFIPNEWSTAADLIACGAVSFPIAFVCGPKKSGKTTFARHLVNVLLQRHKRVAFLDTDVGQTEFTPPGLLALTVIDKITPDLTIPCVKTPARCFFFGDISSKRDPTTYLTYIKALYDHYMETEIQGAGLPLVINTPGWVKGIGYEILVEMLRYISVTHVVKLQRLVLARNLPDGAFWLNEGDADATTTTVIEINAPSQNHLTSTAPMREDARLLRDLRLMAYFRQCFPSDTSISTIKELSHALASHPPYEIPISSIKIKHLHCQVATTETFYSLNATIVGMAISSVSEQLPQCVGLGIVRAVDTFKGVLYVITPVPPHILEDVDLLLQGFIQIPISLLQVQGCISPYLSTNVLSTN